MGTQLLSDAVTLRASQASPAEWDRFAHRCRASFRCAYWAGGAWQFEYHRLFRLRRFDVMRDTPRGPRKVGQCALGVGRRFAVFSDGLQLLPDFKALWPAAMTAVLARIGPREYVYGSEWSVEPPRQYALGRLAGVAVDVVRPTDVQVIDLSRWTDFAEYLMSASSNVRRNVKKAQKSYPGLRIVDAPLSRVDHFIQSVRLRRSLFLRKGVHRSTAGMVVRSLARLLSLKRYSLTANLLAGRELLASYTGVHFGRQFCYMEGASDHEGRGAAWFLLMAMIERAFDASDGDGLFVMGSDDGTQAGDPAWEGLRRSRRQCCAEPMPTSVVTFTYAPVEADLGRARAAKAAVRRADRLTAETAARVVQD